MNYEELKKIGEWLNTKGYGIHLTDDFWMEEYEWGEHKTRDICQMLFDYHTEQCNIADVRLSCFKEVFEKFQEIEHESEFYGWLYAKAHEA